MMSGGPFVRAALCSLAILWASQARAADCTINPQPVAFGNYDSLGEQWLDGVGSIQIDCDAVVSFTLSLGSGNGSPGTRQMTSGADRLEYNLYTNASRTLVWGDESNGSNVSVTAEDVDLTVYGRIPARQNVPAGDYGDSVTVTLTY